MFSPSSALLLAAASPSNGTRFPSILAHLIPAPYRLAKIPGGTALRLAMVHDVLHERYFRHGAAWYAQRNADARKIIADQKRPPAQAPSVHYLDAFDDLAVGLERTGNHAEAIAVLQEKLRLVAPLPTPPATRPAFDANKTVDRKAVDRLDLEKILAAQTLSPLQHHQYTALANLGTVLILDALPKLFTEPADLAPRAQLRQSLDCIEQAIAINPGGHFGREAWQAILTEHLLAALDHPDLLNKYDMIGEPLSEDTEVLGLWRVYARFATGGFDPNISADQRLEIRSRIDRLGIDPGWAAIVNPDYPCPMPFDEPTLAIVGMWTLGGGPNPHFALALGRIMDNMGQRHIAWDAYERAVELQDHFWPDVAIRSKFVALCRARQNEIGKLEDRQDPAWWQQNMRARHGSELAWGRALQKAYHDFEASRIAAGVSLNDPNFYTPFYQSHPSIASSPGLSDDAIVVHLEAKTWMDFLPCLVLGIGVGLALGVMIPEKRLS